jgi:hypothetical protein
MFDLEQLSTWDALLKRLAVPAQPQKQSEQKTA